MPRTPKGLSDRTLGVARAITGVIAADSATLTDANFPINGAFDCGGFETVFVGVEIDGGASPTATIEPLFRDEDAADGARWKRMLVGSVFGVTALGAAAVQSTGALASGASLVEIRVFGRRNVFFRVSAVANAVGTTGMSVLVMGGQPRSAAMLRQ